MLNTDMSLAFDSAEGLALDTVCGGIAPPGGGCTQNPTDNGGALTGFELVQVRINGGNGVSGLGRRRR